MPEEGARRTTTWVKTTQESSRTRRLQATTKTRVGRRTPQTNMVTFPGSRSLRFWQYVKV